MDANGDGCGDFEGLSRKLDYLKGLGVDALWLAPFQPTPGRDDGYDITDYYGVDPRFGSTGDFVEFMHEASSRGMRVIIDLVVNHTVRPAPLVQGRPAASRDVAQARLVCVVGEAAAGLGHRDGVPRRAAIDVDAMSDRRGEYYFHRFYDFEPDLNMANPLVREEVRRVIGYWLELGVAGFRVDAVPFVLEKPSTDGGRATLNFDWLHEIREFLQWRPATPPCWARPTCCRGRRSSTSQTATACT